MTVEPIGLRLAGTRVAALVAASLAVALLPAGCASAPQHSDALKSALGSVKYDPRLHAELPGQVRSRGTVRVLTDASYAPASSFAPDGRTIIGFEPDLGTALGRVLGVRFVFRNAGFEQLPGMIETDRAELIMSAMTDTAEREKRLDFVDYFSAGTSFVVQRGNPHGISDLESLCGQRVAVERGTVQDDLLARQQPRCGSTPIHVIEEPTNDDAVVLLRTGKAAALPMDYPPANALTSDPRTRGSYQLATTAQYEPGLYGIGVDRSDIALREAVQGALTELMASGVYRAILRKWHVSAGAVPAASVDAARPAR
jgi:polar amino acid transport system substrate-binding protein